MDVNVVELTDTKAVLVLSKTNPAIVNSLRRVLLSDIPKMAVHNVEFHMGPIMGDDGKEYESKTPLFDEMIAHRLGMIPIPSDVQSFKNREECDCKGEGCPQCTIMYTINKKGPCTVYSGDMEPLGDKNFAVRDNIIPIVKLDRDQAILIYATAIQGTARRHIKWQVTNTVTCRYWPAIKISEKVCDKGGGCVKACPAHVLEQDKNGAIKVAHPERCTLCGACVDTCVPMGKPGSDKAISVDGDSSKFYFTFETDGSRKAKDVLNMALDILDGMFNELKDKLSEAGEKE